MESDARDWFMRQVTESINRLANSSPETLSPTGRRLREEAAKWFESTGFAVEAGTTSPNLHIVRSKMTTPKALDRNQLPLLGSIPKQW